MAKDIKNIGASVHTRMLSLSKANGQSIELVLTRSAIERLLFRPNRLRYAGRFVLKSSMPATSWFEDPHRGARGLALLGPVIRVRMQCLRRSR